MAHTNVRAKQDITDMLQQPAIVSYSTYSLDPKKIKTLKFHPVCHLGMPMNHREMLNKWFKPLVIKRRQHRGEESEKRTFRTFLKPWYVPMPTRLWVAHWPCVTSRLAPRVSALTWFCNVTDIKQRKSSSRWSQLPQVYYPRYKQDVAFMRKLNCNWHSWENV